MGELSLLSRREACFWIAGAATALLTGCSSGSAGIETYERALRQSLGTGDERLKEVIDYLESFPTQVSDPAPVRRWLDRRPEGAIRDGIRAYRSVRDVSAPSELREFHRRLVDVADARAEALGHIGDGLSLLAQALSSYELFGLSREQLNRVEAKFQSAQAALERSDQALDAARAELERASRSQSSPVLVPLGVLLRLISRRRR